MNGGPGVLFAIAIAVVVHLVLMSDSVIPEVVAAWAVGAAVRNVGYVPWVLAGARFVIRYGLRVAVIALGADLDLRVVTRRAWPLSCSSLSW